MYADNDNYLRFLRDIKGHLKLPMVEVKDYCDSPYLGFYSFPRGRCGDAEWIFNHDTAFDTARSRWQRGEKGSIMRTT